MPALADAVARPHAVKRRMGVMPQEATLYWGLSVRHHLRSLSGQTDVWFELAVLAGFALVTMALGTWRLPWRED